MSQQQFRVSNAAGMWLRTEPIVSEATKKVLLPKGQLITKLGDTNKPDWWNVSTNFQAEDFTGFSNRNLMVADGAPPTSGLVAKTLATLGVLAPNAHPNYLKAISNGGPLFAGTNA